MNAADAEEARALFKQGRRRHYAKDNVTRMPGPLCPEADLVGVSHRTLLKTQGACITENIMSDLHGMHERYRAVCQ